ncbi:MAG: hypothetical protein ACR2KV_16670 [Solirubrobacteraceae bacterium]
MLLRSRQRLAAAGGLVVLLGCAAAFRALGYLAAGPLLAPSDDSLRFARGGLVALFSDPFAPSGYPVLLAAVGRSAPAVSVVQHLLGLLTVALLWQAGRELSGCAGVPRWLAAVPAVFVAFSGDQWFFEQSLMSETLFTVLVVGAVLAMLRADGPSDRPLAWSAVAGAALAAAGVTRLAGFAAAAVGLVWLLLWARPPLGRRGRTAAAYVLGAAAVVAVYVGAASGHENGIGSYAGWSLYGRVGPFADCAKFTPPAGTRALCEPRPPDARPGVYFYLFSTGASSGEASPAVALFHGAPNGNAELRRFALRAIESEPLAYLRTVAKDAIRYVDPAYGNHRPEAGIGPEFVYLGTSLTPYPARSEVERLYGYHVGSGPLRFPFESWLTLSRVPGLLWLAGIAAVVGGLAVGRSGPRRRLILVAGVAFALYMTPVMTVTYEYRYAVPAQGLALLAGVLGAWLFAQRLHGRTPAP